LASARRYWAARELRRIEIAGYVLRQPDKDWLAAEQARDETLGAMNRLDEGFRATPKARAVASSPDLRFDSLSDKSGF